jgi:membrane-associated protease RseP (regulator of RpoE activity)
MVGADSLLFYRILPIDTTRTGVIQSSGGTVSGGLEVDLIRVSTGTSLFRQTVTAKTLFPRPSPGKSWSEAEVIRAHGIASEEAAAYGFSALGASLGVNPLGIIPFSETGLVRDVLPSSPAETAGLQKRDKIVSVNNRQFRSWTDRIDLPATMTVLREGKELDLTVSSR